jgi:acyl-CoA thioester hydrolase
MARPDPHRLHDYPHSRVLTTRWIDSDPYGHMNNAVHYFLFDTVVNAWLIEHGALDIQKSLVIGLVVETGCHYFAPLTYPEPVTAALRVAHIGRSSVRYELALFGAASRTAARGHFVHVYVDREGRRLRRASAALQLALKPLRSIHSQGGDMNTERQSSCVSALLCGNGGRPGAIAHGAQEGRHHQRSRGHHGARRDRAGSESDATRIRSRDGYVLEGSSGFRSWPADEGLQGGRQLLYPQTVHNAKAIGARQSARHLHGREGQAIATPQ